MHLTEHNPSIIRQLRTWGFCPCDPRTEPDCAVGLAPEASHQCSPAPAAAPHNVHSGLAGRARGAILLLHYCPDMRVCDKGHALWAGAGNGPDGSLPGGESSGPRCISPPAGRPPRPSALGWKLLSQNPSPGLILVMCWISWPYPGFEIRKGLDDYKYFNTLAIFSQDQQILKVSHRPL